MHLKSEDTRGAEDEPLVPRVEEPEAAGLDTHGSNNAPDDLPQDQGRGRDTERH